MRDKSKIKFSNLKIPEGYIPPACILLGIGNWIYSYYRPNVVFRSFG
jgi:hypothetical protein